MSRKSIGILTVFLLFGLVAGWYYFTNESKYFNTSAFRAVPPNSSIIIRVKKLSAFSSKASGNFIFTQFSSFPLFSVFSKQLNLVDSILHHDPASEKYLSEKDILLSYGGQKGKMSFLYLLELSDMAEKTTIKNLVKEYFAKRSASSLNRKKGAISIDIYYWSTGPSTTTFCVSFYKGVFIAGTDPDRVLEAASQLDLPAVTENAEFQKLYKTASPNADLNVFINRRNFGEIAARIFTSGYLKKINTESQYTKWAELDFNVKQNELFFNGMMMPSDSINDFMGVLIRQRPARFDLDQHLPYETSYFQCLNINDVPAYFNDYEKTLANSQGLTSYKNRLTEADTLYGVNLQEIVKNNLNNQAGLFYTAYNDSLPLGNRYFIMKIKNENRLDSLMLKLVKPVVPGKRILFRGLKEDFKIGKDTVYKISQIPIDNFAERVFGPVFSGVPTSYYTICDSCMIMAASFKAIEDYLISVSLKETLGKNFVYSDFLSGLSQPLTFFLWGKPAFCLPFFRSDLNPDIYSKLENQQDSLQRLQSFGWLITAEKGMIYNLGRIAYNNQIHNRPIAVWRFKTDTVSLSKPQFVMISTDSDKPDVLVQDKNYNLYLISDKGQLKWKKKLPNQIISEIHQVKYFRDRRLQFLFNTADHLYMIDGNGNNVPGFPVRFKSRATNGIGVFDYDNTLDYRIFVACEDRTVYAFDRNGNQITGWQTSPVEGKVSRPVQFFRVQGKDYIVYSDNKKTYIMDRKGNVRVALQQDVSPSVNNNFTLEPPGQGHPARLVTTDSNGTINLVSFDGSVKTMDVGKFSPDHYFVDDDLDNDGRMEYIFLDGNSLKAYNAEGRLVFTKNYKNKIDMAPVVSVMPGKGKKLGIVERAANQIHLYHHDGTEYKGFPVEGNTAFDLDYSNYLYKRINLLAGSPDGYLNNYSIK